MSFAYCYVEPSSFGGRPIRGGSSMKATKSSSSTAHWRPNFTAGPFYHDGRGVWVMPFDLLTAAPTYELVLGWEVRP